MDSLRTFTCTHTHSLTHLIALIHLAHTPARLRVHIHLHTHTNTRTHAHTLLPDVEVTEDFLETGVLAVEVWGHRRSGFEMNSLAGSEDPEGKRPKSFMER